MQRTLIETARRLFAEKGYAATGTPELVTTAGVTRGALYHHFPDKQALFIAVVEAEYMLVSMALNAATETGGDEPGPVKTLVLMGEAAVDALAEPGRRRLLLIEAPAVIDPEQLDAIKIRSGGGLLVEKVTAAIAAKAIRDLPAQPLATLLLSLFERAAMAPSETRSNHRKTIKALIRGLKL